MYALGDIGVSDNTTIAANKPYTFVFSTFSGKASVEKKLSNLQNMYAQSISVTDTGLMKIVVNLTPLYNMPLYAWRNIFSNQGLDDMTDVYIGDPMNISSPLAATISSPVQNISDYWKPKIKALSNVGNSAMKTIQRTVIIIGITGLISIAVYGYFRGRGARPETKR